MKRLLQKLDGKKSILGILLGAIYSVLIAVKLVESNELMWTLLATWTGISFRLAMNK